MAVRPLSPAFHSTVSPAPCYNFSRCKMLDMATFPYVTSNSRNPLLVSFEVTSMLVNVSSLSSLKISSSFTPLPLSMEGVHFNLGFDVRSAFTGSCKSPVDVTRWSKRNLFTTFYRPNGKTNSRFLGYVWSADLSALATGAGRRTSKKSMSRNISCRTMGGPIFEDEAIGAEHGEGFGTFRPCGPLHVDVDYLNDRMKTRGLQRIRFAMRPDEAFGLIYSLDNVLVDTRALKLEAWKQLALEEDRDPDYVEASQRHIAGGGVERAIRQVLAWTRSEPEVSRLTNRLTEIYSQHFAKVKTPVVGAREWLQAMHRERVPCAVASSMDRISLLATLDRVGLSRYFCAFVSDEDGMDSLAHRFLSAAVKMDRPPAKCVVFEDDPRGVAAAHNCSMKAIALIGTHPAYELTQADLTVSNYNELSVINLRRLFAAHGLEFMDLQKQEEDKELPKRRTGNDTLF